MCCMEYINGRYYFYEKDELGWPKDVTVSGVADEFVDGDDSVFFINLHLHEIFKTLEDLISNFKVDMQPYNRELDRLCLAKTAALCKFNSSKDEINRLREYERTIGKECRAIIDKFIMDSCHKGFNILKEMVSSEFDYILPDIFVEEIEDRIISFKDELTLGRWVERCDDVLLKIHEQRIWKNYSLSDIDMAVKERNDKITELEKQKPPAITEKEVVNEKIKELARERENVSFFSFNKKKSIDAEIDSLWQKISELNTIIDEQRKEQSDSIENTKKEIEILAERKNNLYRWNIAYRYLTLCIEILKESTQPISREEVAKLLVAKDNTFNGIGCDYLGGHLRLLEMVGVVIRDDKELWSLADVPEKEINDKMMFDYRTVIRDLRRLEVC